MSKSYIKGIEGLRAVAVIAVILFHLNPDYLPGGYTGVDVFFVISGYVVAGSLYNQRHTSLAKFISGFYRRRILRIFPALILCLGATTLSTILFVPDAWLSSSIDKTGLYSFFGLGNWAQVIFNDGYFAARAEYNPFTHCWSLGIEEQFYLIAPFFVYLGVSNLSKQRCSFLSEGIILVLILTSIIYCAWQTSSNLEAAFYLLPSRFWELAAGVSLAQFHARAKLIPETKLSIKSSLYLGTTLVAISYSFNHTDSFPFPMAVFPILGTLLIITGFRGSNNHSERSNLLFENKVSMGIGKLSYSLYLYHWPVIVIFRWTVGLESIWNLVAASVLFVGLALFSYHLVEKRFSRVRSSHKHSDLKISSIGVLAIISAWGLCYGAFEKRSSISFSTVSRQPEIWLPSSWRPVEVQQRNEYLRDRTLFALGDSHVAAYRTMFKMLSEELGVNIELIYGAGKSVVSLERPNLLADDKLKPEIDQKIQYILSKAKKGDIVFLASLRIPRLCGDEGPYNIDEIKNKFLSQNAQQDRVEALAEGVYLVDKLQAAGLNVMIDAPKPVFNAMPYRGSDWFNENNPAVRAGFKIQRNFLLDYRRPIVESINELKSVFPDMIVWDPFSVLCPEELCDAFRNGKPMFFDSDHLSGYGNKVLYKSFRAEVLNCWNNP